MEDTARRILIIEDDRFISEMYARTLRKNGFVVEESITGPEGLAKAKKGGWSFILLDIMLPDKTGVEIIHEIRESLDKGVSDVKIVIITNFEQDDATRQTMEKLADGYLIKAEITPRRMAEIINDMSSASAEKNPVDTDGAAASTDNEKPPAQDPEVPADQKTE